MKKIRITDYIIPIYLAVILLLQLQINITTVLLSLLPILIIILAIYFKDKNRFNAW